MRKGRVFGLVAAAAMALAAGAACAGDPSPDEVCSLMHAGMEDAANDYASLTGAQIPGSPELSSTIRPFDPAAEVYCTITPRTADFPAQFGCMFKKADITAVDAAVQACVPGWRRVYDSDPSAKGKPMIDYFQDTKPGLGIIVLTHGDDVSFVVVRIAA